MAKMFTQMQLQAISDALADPSEGLTGSEIHHLLMTCKMMISTLKRRSVTGSITRL
jgi:hypothetical protein